jgi:hypothetical protein
MQTSDRLTRLFKGSITDPARPLWTKLVSVALFVIVALLAAHGAHASTGTTLFVASNSFQYVDWLTMEGLRILKNKLVSAQFANMDHNEDYEQEFAVGQTIRVPLPQRWTVRDGLEYQEQPINRIYTTIACDQIFGIDFGWDSAEAALKMERGRERVKKEYIDPAIDQIAQEIDSASRCSRIRTRRTSSASSAPTRRRSQTINQARQRMVELAVAPRATRACSFRPR